MNKTEERTDNRLFTRRTLVVAGVLLLTALALYLLFRLRTLLFMVFVALFIAVALEPPVHFLEKRGWKRGLATGLVFLVVFLLIVAFVALLVPLFVNQFNELIDQLPGYIESVAQQLNDWFNLDLSTESLQQEAAKLPDIIAGSGGTILGGVVSVTTGIFSFLFFATTVALFSFYMIAELPKLQRTVLSTMNQERQRDALHIWDVAVEKMGLYIYSRLILALLSGLLTAGFLTLLGVPFAVSLGIWVGVLSQFIPVVGTYLAAILPAVVALSSGGCRHHALGDPLLPGLSTDRELPDRAPDHPEDHGDPPGRVDRGHHHRLGSPRSDRGDPGAAHDRDRPGAHLRDQK